MAALARFETITDLKYYMIQITGFKYRVALAGALRDAVNRRSGKNDTTAAVENKCVRMSRKDRTVTIHGDEPMASVFLGGGYGREGRTVAAADYGVIRDEDLLAPAVSFLAFEGN